MMNEKYVKTTGSLSRTIQALDGFRAKYGVWPSQLVLGTKTFEVLKEESLTPTGLELLEQKVRLSCCEEEHYIVALDDEGRSYDYDVDCWKYINNGPTAQEWIGFGR